MFVCFCDKINEDAIHELVAAGAQTPEDIYNAVGRKKTARCDTCPTRVAAAMFPPDGNKKSQTVIALVTVKP